MPRYAEVQKGDAIAWSRDGGITWNDGRAADNEKGGSCSVIGQGGMFVHQSMAVTTKEVWRHRTQEPLKTPLAKRREYEAREAQIEEATRFDPGPPPKPVERVCGNCRFHEHTAQQCRANPPVVLVVGRYALENREDNVETHYPETGLEERACGCWEPESDDGSEA